MSAMEEIGNRVPIFIHRSVPMTLRNGKEVLLRPIEPGDRDRFIQGLSLFSAESLYLRFFAPISNLTDAQLKNLTDVDQIDHVAWGAVDPTDPEFPGFGVGRFVRTAEDPEVAEIAIAVIDAYQRQGLGTILAGLLYVLARAAGIRGFRGTVLPANQFMIDWLRDLGGQIHFHEGFYEIKVPIYQDLGALSPNQSARRFRGVVEEIEDKVFFH